LNVVGRARVGGLTVLLLLSHGIATAEPLRISVATSMGPALRDALTSYPDRDAHPAPLVHSAASAVLLQQCLRGAPTDLLISASPKEIDELIGAGLAANPTRRALASNRLAVIVPCGAPGPRALDDLRRVEFDRIAVGNPRTAPLGRYTRQALESDGLLDEISDRLVFAENSRRVLDYVARGETPLGVVYLSDARLRADRVCVAIEIPERLHDPIAYEAVVLRDSALATEAGSLLEWLASPAGRAALTRHGFLPPPPSAR
jgi:molybdate transport system substrate-binding protein